MLNFDILPRTNEYYKSVTIGCMRNIDSYRFCQAV